MNEYINLTPKKKQKTTECDHHNNEILEEIQGKTWPMVAHVSDDLVCDIVNNEYIKFKTLLEDKTLSKEIPKKLREVSAKLVWQVQQTKGLIDC